MTAVARKPLRILVVDDDELDRLAVRRCLLQSGVDTRADEAPSVAATLERIGTTTYDCILLDYYLPGENSLALLHDLQTVAPGTPVVIFTGRGDEDIAVELMKSGAADYLPKASLTPERLAAAIRHAREVTRTAAARRRAESLLRLSSAVAQHLLAAGSADELLRGLFDKVREPLGVDAWFNYTVNRTGSRLRLVSWGGIPDAEVKGLAELPCGATVAGHDAAAREALAQRARDCEQQILRELESCGLRACSCHPLLSDHRVLGWLCFASRAREEFREDEVDFFRTISHYAAVAWERLRYIEEMRRSDRRKDEFLATLAHELRDPLAPLSNVLELLKRANSSSDVLQQARDTMERQLAHLVQLVDDLLDMSRITRSRLDLRKCRVDLQAIVDQAVETARPLAESLGHDLKMSLPQEVVYLHADPVRLAQVFGNLLTNAFKYTEPAGDIALLGTLEGGHVVVTVKDSGIGIPQDELATVFDMFSQSPSARKLSQGGLGIGLTLVKRLVAMHGGSVEARSKGLGQGSEFVVRLPVLDQAAGVGPADAPAEAPEAENRRILIVDDNRDSAASLAMLLSMTGNTIREAYDGLAAVTAAAEFCPDVVLLDIGLPKLDGFEVCRRIRAEAWGSDILIVALSGWGQEDDRRKSHAAGFDHHLVKPVKYADLMQLLSVSVKRPQSAGHAG